jgi:hypothetical protein
MKTCTSSLTAYAVSTRFMATFTIPLDTYYTPISPFSKPLPSSSSSGHKQGDTPLLAKSKHTLASKVMRKLTKPLKRQLLNHPLLSLPLQSAILHMRTNTGPV